MHLWKTKKQSVVIACKEQACAHPVSWLDTSLWDHVLLCKGQAKPRVNSVLLLGCFRPARGCRRVMLSAAHFKPECFSFKWNYWEHHSGFNSRSCVLSGIEDSWHLGISEEVFCYTLLSFHLRFSFCFVLFLLLLFYFYLLLLLCVCVFYMHVFALLVYLVPEEVTRGCQTP